MLRSTGPELDAATIRQEIDPRNLLEEVDAQLRIAGAWMSEAGIGQRCRLAKNQAEVVGALIELKRQGCAESLEHVRVLWRAVHGTNLHLPETTDAGRRSSRRSCPTNHEPTEPAQPAAAQPITERVIPMKTPHHDRATPVLEALIAGPMTRQELAQKTGFNLGHISDTLCNLKALGRVARGERRTWSLRSGGAVAPAGSRRKGQRVAPPRARGESLVPVNGAGPRWFLGNDGSVRLEHNGAAIELDPGQFDTLRRAHAVIKAASAPEA